MCRKIWGVLAHTANSNVNFHISSIFFPYVQMHALHHSSIAAQIFAHHDIWNAYAEQFDVSRVVESARPSCLHDLRVCMFSACFSCRSQACPAPPKHRCSNICTPRYLACLCETVLCVRAIESARPNCLHDLRVCIFSTCFSCRSQACPASPKHRCSNLFQQQNLAHLC